MMDQKSKYRKAVKQVEQQKSWYSHLFVFFVINTIVQLFYWGVFEGIEIFAYMPWWARFTMPAGWGVSLLIHYLYAFKPHLWENNFVKRWEQRKIEQFMLEEEQEFKTRFKNEVEQ